MIINTRQACPEGSKSALSPDIFPLSNPARSQETWNRTSLLPVASMEDTEERFYSTSLAASLESRDPRPLLPWFQNQCSFLYMWLKGSLANQGPGPRVFLEVGWQGADPVPSRDGIEESVATTEVGDPGSRGGMCLSWWVGTLRELGSAVFYFFI